MRVKNSHLSTKTVFRSRSRFDHEGLGERENLIASGVAQNFITWDLTSPKRINVGLTRPRPCGGQTALSRFAYDVNRIERFRIGFAPIGRPAYVHRPADLWKRILCRPSHTWSTFAPDPCPLMFYSRRFAKLFLARNGAPPCHRNGVIIVRTHLPVCGARNTYTSVRTGFDGGVRKTRPSSCRRR